MHRVVFPSREGRSFTDESKGKTEFRCARTSASRQRFHLSSNFNNGHELLVIMHARSVVVLDNGASTIKTGVVNANTADEVLPEPR